MTGELLTIVFGFRNRDLLRVERCLESLRQQTSQGFRVILVDYGSEPGISKEVSSLVETFGFCEYVYTETRGWPWNRSRALNIGIRRAKTKYVMTTDIDLIFDPEFIAHSMVKANTHTALHASCYYLPRGFRKWSKLSSLKRRFKTSPSSALGLMLLARENFEKIGGFDEFYQFWGAEDRDIAHRLNLTGVKTEWLDLSECKLYHQWHPENNNHTFSFLPSGFWEYVEMYFGKNYAKPVRNELDHWGNVTVKNQRPALDLMDKTQSATVTFSSAKELAAADIGREVSKLFYGLNSGESLRLESEFRQHGQLVLYLVNRLNRLCSILGIGYQIIPNRNPLKDAFWSFVRNHETDITDYAVSTDENCYYLIKS